MNQDPPLELEVLETRIARPGLIGSLRGQGVSSAIAKRRSPASRLMLTDINLDGDDQADRSVHGGPDKSVYCYPEEHRLAWLADGFGDHVNGVGENAVLRGLTESDVRIGDVWTWGDAMVQISQPRAPCFKLTMHTGRKDIAGAMIASGRCGWYLRTVRPGLVETTGRMTLVERSEVSSTVAEAFAVMFPGHRPEADDAKVVERVLRSPALAPEWIGYVTARNPLAPPR